MTDDEQLIMNFLGASPDAYYARKEIARRAVKRQVFEENPHWADAPIASLMLMGKLEQNNSGLYRLKRDREGP